MTVAFLAKHVFAGQEGDVVTVGFADDERAPARYLLLQRSLRPGGDDVRLGMDDVYLEYADQQRSAYGGIRRVELRRDGISLDLEVKTAAALGVDPDLFISFAESPGDLERLRMGLRQILSERAPLIDRTA